MKLVNDENLNELRRTASVRTLHLHSSHKRAFLSVLKLCACARVCLSVNDIIL